MIKRLISLVVSTAPVLFLCAGTGVASRKNEAKLAANVKSKARSSRSLFLSWVRFSQLQTRVPRPKQFQGRSFPVVVKNSRVLLAKLPGSGYHSLFVSTIFSPSTSTLSSSSPPLTISTSTSFSLLNCSAARAAIYFLVGHIGQ